MLEKRLSNLDLVRGLAALAVCAGHLRAFIMVDWGEVAQKNALHSVFYALTGYSHQAVMVFFVLSGFLVGGRTFAQWRTGQWGWKPFLIQRLVRLEIVLIPALLATLLLDSIGMRITGGTGYDGAYFKLLYIAPSLEKPLDLSAPTFLANLTFLQTIVTSWFGTDGPLWSLANEFWYYLMFPLALGGLKGGPVSRIASVVLLALLLAWLPGELLWLGLIWLYGMAAAAALESALVRAVAQSRPALLVSGALFGTSLVGYKYGKWFGNDWMVGGAFALFLLCLACTQVRSLAYRKVAARMADMSYTLYLFHLPFIFFVWFCFMAPAQYAPGFKGYAVFFALLAGALAYSYLMWWCFERNTDKVRRWVAGRLMSRPVAPPAVGQRPES